MARVLLRNLTKVFDKNVVAVRNLNLEVHDHEFVVLVGPSGCGKSTTLRMVAGLEEVTEGDIYIGERRVNDVPPKDRDIAMVFQNYALYPHMTVYDNLAFGLKLRKTPKKEIARRVREAAEILGIADLLQRKPRALSGGERQRVAVGRAIVRQPKVFLFDEPLSNLDAKLRVQMRTEIARLHRRLQATMIYVTHDQVEAMTMGDRIVVMKDGVAQQVDTPINLYNRPRNQFVAGFIGSPAMNFLKGRIVSEQDAFWFDSGAVRLRLPSQVADRLAAYRDREVTLGIRAEDLAPLANGGAKPERATTPVTLDVVEHMGNEIYLYVRAGAHTLIARVGPQAQFEVGRRLELAFDLTRAHFFDQQTEEAIGFFPEK